jgi:hypothetical protein
MRTPDGTVIGSRAVNERPTDSNDATDRDLDTAWHSARTRRRPVPSTTRYARLRGVRSVATDAATSAPSRWAVRRDWRPLAAGGRYDACVRPVALVAAGHGSRRRAATSRAVNRRLRPADGAFPPAPDWRRRCSGVHSRLAARGRAELRLRGPRRPTAAVIQAPAPAAEHPWPRVGAQVWQHRCIPHPAPGAQRRIR